MMSSKIKINVHSNSTQWLSCIIALLKASPKITLNKTYTPFISVTLQVDQRMHFLTVVRNL